MELHDYTFKHATLTGVSVTVRADCAPAAIVALQGVVQGWEDWCMPDSDMPTGRFWRDAQELFAKGGPS